MKRDVLDTMPEAELRVYVVWLPVLSWMSPEALAGAAQASAGRIADERVRNYLDPGLHAGEAYKRLLGLSSDNPAWDAYLVFGPQAEWKSDAPRPDFWMHQLSEGPPELRLNSKKLADAVRKLLEGAKKPGSGRGSAADKAEPGARPRASYREA